MISINRCRNLVLYLLEKIIEIHYSYGFWCFLYLAQMDLFENLFYDYNKWILNQKQLTNNSMVDIPKNIKKEQIFSQSIHKF
jgi:hypothetical protein